MDAVVKEYDVGVIIGRFQVSSLHDAHKELINSVISRHGKTILILGMAPLKISTNNPLDFEARRQMIQSEYPNLNILYVKDVKDNAVWSKRVDEVISTVKGANQTAVIYGSRDSFIPWYSGGFPTIELEASSPISGTEHRREIGKVAYDSPEWRAGVIWATQQFYATTYAAVDIAIFTPDGSQLLLGRKPNEKVWRLPGGFSDPKKREPDGAGKTRGFRDDAIRELEEETMLIINDLHLVDTFDIDDWRYEKEPHGIKTILFVGYNNGQVPIAADDIAEVMWVPKTSLPPLGGGEIMSQHRPLIERAINFDTYRRIER